MTLFPYFSEKPGKGGVLCQKTHTNTYTHTHIHTYTHIHTHTHTQSERWQSSVAAGHTSGGTVGQWTRVGEGKMNQVAQHRLMISEGMRG